MPPRCLANLAGRSGAPSYHSCRSRPVVLARSARRFKTARVALDWRSVFAREPQPSTRLLARRAFASEAARPARAGTPWSQNAGRGRRSGTTVAGPGGSNTGVSYSSPANARTSLRPSNRVKVTKAVSLSPPARATPPPLRSPGCHHGQGQLLRKETLVAVGVGHAGRAPSHGRDHLGSLTEYRANLGNDTMLMEGRSCVRPVPSPGFCPLTATCARSRRPFRSSLAVTDVRRTVVTGRLVVQISAT